MLCLLSKIFDFKAYVCGQHFSCLEHNSMLALQKAKYNLEKKFVVFGILEEFVPSLKVFEKMMPEFMSGITQQYTKSKNLILSPYKIYPFRKSSGQLGNRSQVLDCNKCTSCL